MSEPLLLNHYDNEHDDQQIREEEFSWKPTTTLPSRKRWLGVVFGALSLTLLGMTVAVLLTPTPLAKTYEEQQQQQHENQTDQPIKNVIMMISDGLGPASVSFARTYYQYVHGHPYDYELPLDTIHIGQSRTRSSNTLVTDSAAGATAFSCGLKTFNGAIAVDPQGKPCGTILESAKHHHHMKTGLVATSRITHATPASFSAHVTDRDNENAIAKQQIGDYPLGRSLDLMFGGGYCQFLPKKGDQQSCRKDDRHLLREASTQFNWTTVLHGDRHAWDDLPTDASILPIISLFTPEHMSYEIDRDQKKEPSLSEMSEKSLQLLFEATKESEKGFFLMIEGSRIDMAAHSNDAATHVHDILEYQNTVALVKSFIDKHPDTIMISTSDHETGGLSLARQVSKQYPKYLWYPDVLQNVKRSTVQVAAHILTLDHHSRQQAVQDQLGIMDMTKEEIQKLSEIKSRKQMDQYLADMVSLRSQLGWATHGHSGVDVNLYAYGRNIDPLRGSHENTEIGHFISSVLGLDLDDITKQLNKNDPSFQLTPLTDKIKAEYTDHLEHYQHDNELLHHPTT